MSSAKQGRYRGIVLGMSVLSVAFMPLSSETACSRKLRVFVSIPPQAFFVDRIGGSQVQVDVLVPPGSSPETYAPTSGQMLRLSDAETFFSIGVPFEKSFLPKIRNLYPQIRVVDTSEGVSLLDMADSSDHHHGGKDPHIWLDPVRVKTISKHIYRTLCDLCPEASAEFHRNLSEFSQELDDLNTRIVSKLKSYRGEEFYVFHPAFGYFADRYGLRQVAVEEEGKEPGPRRLPGLIDRMKKRKVTTLFVQKQFPSNVARVIAREVGARVVPLDPLAQDYIKNLESIADEIVKALSSRRKTSGG